MLDSVAKDERSLEAKVADVVSELSTLDVVADDEIF